MDIHTVGNLSDQSIKRRYLFDIDVRKYIEKTITDFCSSLNFNTGLKMEWKNLGSESDIYERGVALRVNDCYELRYLLVSEDFNFWYYDRTDPKIIIEDVEPSSDLYPVLLELLKNLAEDFAKTQAIYYLDKSVMPTYPGDPVIKKQPVTQEFINEHLRKF
jgi:hypothetical protein